MEIFRLLKIFKDWWLQHSWFIYMHAEKWWTRLVCWWFFSSCFYFRRRFVVSSHTKTATGDTNTLFYYLWKSRPTSKTHKRLNRTLFNQIKQDRIQIFEGILFLKATHTKIPLFVSLSLSSKKPAVNSVSVLLVEEYSLVLIPNSNSCVFSVNWKYS